MSQSGSLNNGSTNSILEFTGGTGTSGTFPVSPNGFGQVSFSSTDGSVAIVGGVNSIDLSVETLPVPGTSGNVLTSDGTNWISAAPAGGTGILFTQVNISSVDFKLSQTTPIEIVPAPGAGLILMPIRAIMKLNYGGTNQFTGTATPSIYYTTVGLSNGRIGQSSSGAYQGSLSNYSTFTIFDLNLIQQNLTNNSISYISDSTNPAGNAANNNTVTVGVWYVISPAII
jgi:hypothetical protein|tara:strand:+ start:52 stop:735 length:684 start_codon:yes stop_codon:yes gene_type:complete